MTHSSSDILYAKKRMDERAQGKAECSFCVEVENGKRMGKMVL